MGLRSTVIAIQVSAGSTGDITPWHGTPIDSKYAIDSAVWREFWVNASLDMVTIHSDLLPGIHLLFNGVDNAISDWPEYTAVMFDVLKPPNFFIKCGVQSHQFMTNYEVEQYNILGNLTRTPYQGPDGQVTFVRSRGEMSDSNPSNPFWQYPVWNLISLVSWDLTFGLDMLNPNPQIWSYELGHSIKAWTPTVWTALEHYRTYAGQKLADESPGAWILLRDGLDFGDDVRFPNETYGPAEVSNVKRLRSIVKEFAAMGAAVDDEEAAIASRHNSRDRKGLNDAGFHIWPTNYAQFIEQLDPFATSLGRWRVGSSDGVLGRFARQTNGSSMGFRLHPEFNPGSTPFVRVAFFDEGSGSWGLRYAVSGGSRFAFSMQKGNTREWIEVRIQLSDFHCCAAGGPHLELVDDDFGELMNNGADADTFGWLEIQKENFVMQLAPKVVHATAEVSSIIGGFELLV